MVLTYAQRLGVDTVSENAGHRRMAAIVPTLGLTLSFTVGVAIAAGWSSNGGFSGGFQRGLVIGAIIGAAIALLALARELMRHRGH